MLSCSKYFCKSKLFQLSFIIGSKETKKMAHTRFEYVRSFELEDKLEPLQWIVLKIECFEYKSLFSPNYTLESGLIFQKQMASSAAKVMREINEIALGYGYRNTFNFVLRKDTSLYNRRGSKLLSNITSLLMSHFTLQWTGFTSNNSDKFAMFDGSIYLLPHNHCLREYFSTEQRSCHKINLEETTLHYLTKKAKINESEVANMIKTSNESQKNEFLFSLCDINYNNEPVENKKGYILVRGKSIKSKEKKINTLHADFKKDEFWSSSFPLEFTVHKKSKYINIELFKRKSNIIPHMFLVIRIDGKGFHRFSELNKFEKPNDDRSLNLMNAAAKIFFRHFPKMKVSYGQSDEYSFIFPRYAHGEKDGYSLISRIVSLFTFSYVKFWKLYFSDEQPMVSNPAFDARLVMYPTVSVVKDYLCWRQADCHINNMYNTCFWKLVTIKHMSRKESQDYLMGTFSKDKLSILKNELQVEYNQDTLMHRRGTIMYTINKDKMGNDCLKVENSDILIDDSWLEDRQLFQEEWSNEKYYEENFSEI